MSDQAPQESFKLPTVNFGGLCVSVALHWDCTSRSNWYELYRSTNTQHPLSLPGHGEIVTGQSGQQRGTSATELQNADTVKLNTRQIFLYTDAHTARDVTVVTDRTGDGCEG